MCYFPLLEQCDEMNQSEITCVDCLFHFQFKAVMIRFIRKASDLDEGFVLHHVVFQLMLLANGNFDTSVD